MFCTLTINTDSGLKEQITTEVGRKLLEVLNSSGHGQNAPCGGRGICGKCRMRAQGALSAPNKTELGLLSAEELQNGVRMACMTLLEGDAQVWLAEEKANILLSGEHADITLLPAVAAEKMEVPAPSLQDQRSDLERLRAAVGAENIRLPVLKKLPEVLRAAEDGVWIVRNLRENCVEDICAEEPALYGAAVDIGTTTIAAYLIDLKTGKTVGMQSAMNPQRAYGADVLSRIDYARQDNGLATLQSEIAGKLNELIGKMLAAADARDADLRQIHCVGNTVMLHLLLGISPENIAATPFIPAFTGRMELPAAEIGLRFANANVENGPCVAGYIGADTTAAALACGMDENEGVSLLLDIGTNGEIALGGREGIVCCSAAAGPAFEGAHIRCGSGAVQGAISSVKLTQDGRVEFKTIGDEKPASICGSGLVDAIAEMLRVGLLDETGRLDEDEAPECWEDRLFDSSAGLAFALTEDKTVYVCQKDVREVQLAKGAIAAGIEILLKQTGVRFEIVQNLFLAGGFGNYIDVHNACQIGLLPPEMEAKTVPVGNAAGTGARMMALNRTACDRVDSMAQHMRYIELSSQKEFTELFSENMLFEE